jgi:hypothetical protein
VRAFGYKDCGLGYFDHIMKVLALLVTLIAATEASNAVDAFFADSNNNNGLVVRKKLPFLYDGTSKLTEVQVAIKKGFNSITLGIEHEMGMYVETPDKLPKEFGDDVNKFLKDIDNQLDSIIEK